MIQNGFWESEIWGVDYDVLCAERYQTTVFTKNLTQGFGNERVVRTDPGFGEIDEKRCIGTRGPNKKSFTGGDGNGEHESRKFGAQDE